MKYLGITSGGVALVACMLVAASAAEPATSVSKTSLQDMGLGGMQAMADHEGLAVRGKGGYIAHMKPHMKPKLRVWFPKKKMHHGFDMKFGHGHKGFRGHGGFKGHKSFGGMLWQPKRMVWNFGGVKIH